MKFDLALDPSRNVVRAGSISAFQPGARHGHRPHPRHDPPPVDSSGDGPDLGLGRGETLLVDVPGEERRAPGERSCPAAVAPTGAGPGRPAGRGVALPVLRAIVPPEALGGLPRGEVAGKWERPREGTREAVFRTTLALEDTLVVPRGARIVGNLEAANVHVQGTVYGQVKATRGCLVVDRGASVHGMVHGAGTVVIAGGVRATGPGPAVVAHGNLRLAQSAHVRGVVRYTVIEIYEGARVAGPLREMEQV